MVPYQLPTGKTIFIKSEDLLFMTDLKEQEYIANDIGCYINNPFYHSAISEDIIIEELTIEEIANLEVEDFDADNI